MSLSTALRRLLFLAAFALLLSSLGSSAWACPTCTQGMEHDPAVMAMARGYFWSILFMMSMPFLIAGGLGTYFYLEIRKARRRAELMAVESLKTVAHTSP